MNKLWLHYVITSTEYLKDFAKQYTTILIFLASRFWVLAKGLPFEEKGYLLMARQSEAVYVQWTTAENSHIFTTITSPFCKVQEHESWWVGSDFHCQASFSLTEWNKWNITARLENLADGHNHPFITDIIVVSSNSDKINNKMAGNKDQDS